MAITNVSVFRSSDGGAISGARGRMSGTAGDAVALFNALLLVTGGYNWQAVTNANLTCSGTTASLTLTNHGFNIDQRLWIIGMDQSGYLHSTTYGDATYLGIVADANTLTFPTTGTPATATTGGGAGGTTTTLSAAITTTGATTFAQTTAGHQPSAIAFVVQIDSEYMLVTGGMGTTTLTVVRGMFGSTAATHLINATITQVIMVGVAPAGGFTAWTSPWTTSTTKASYLPPAGNRMSMDVDDTGTTTTAVRGWEVLTANNTGTGEFPTTGQIASGLQSFCKSNAASTVARAWCATATDRMLILYVDSQNGGALATAADCLVFTDLIDQEHAGDIYATLLICNPTLATSGQTAAAPAVTNSASQAGHYMPRSYTQIGTSINANKMTLDGRAGAGTVSLSGAGGMTYPHPPDGGLYVSKFAVNENGLIIARGNIPGLWYIMHTKPAVQFDTWAGTGYFAGKKFMAVNMQSATPTNCQLALEISNTIQGT
jgi:hypothetical protein